MNKKVNNQRIISDIWMITALMIFILILTSNAQAQVREVTFDLTKIHNKRDPYFPQYNLLGGSPAPVVDADGNLGTEHWSHNVDLGVKSDLYNNHGYVLYWDQDVIGHSTNVQYRKVTWDWELGLKPSRLFDVFWHHRSEHGLEANEGRRYPIEDVYGVRIYLYRMK